jgi:hypothetical protein
VHACVQKFVSAAPMFEQSFAPEFPRQSVIDVQYLPTPSELPLSPGCPQWVCSGLPSPPEASSRPLSAWPDVPLEVPEVPDEVPDVPLEVPDVPLVPELLLVPDEPDEPDEPELDDELQATTPRRHTKPERRTRFMGTSHRQPARRASSV